MPSVVQQRVAQRYIIDLSSKSDCGDDIELFKQECGSTTIYKVIDNRNMLRTMNKSLPADTYIPLRGWQWPCAIDGVTMHIGFGEIRPVSGADFPRLDFRVLVGMGGNTDRVLEGNYQPANIVQATEINEKGLLFQYAGRMFDTLELHVRIVDPSVVDQYDARQMPFVVAMYGSLYGFVESRGQAGLNGTITFLAPSFQKVVNLP